VWGREGTIKSGRRKHEGEGEKKEEEENKGNKKRMGGEEKG